MISLSLALINLFPFLPLDGGHVFWSLVEKVRGQPGPVQRHGAGERGRFLLVMVMFAIGLSNDIGRLTGGGLQPALGCRSLDRLRPGMEMRDQDG